VADLVQSCDPPRAITAEDGPHRRRGITFNVKVNGSPRGEIKRTERKAVKRKKRVQENKLMDKCRRSTNPTEGTKMLDKWETEMNCLVKKILTKSPRR